MKLKRPAVVLLLSSARGIYIPRDFVSTENMQALDLEHCEAWSIRRDTAEACMHPDTDGYWDAWDTVLDTAKYTDAAGDVYTLYQDKDLWALCVERMTDEERKNFGFHVD